MATARSARPRRERVELVGGESVVDRGMAQVTWWVRRGKSWVNAAQWPGAVVEPLDAAAGTVWQSRVLLALPRGTVLLRVESRPGRQARRDPLAWLEHGTRGVPRKLSKSYFRVVRSGDLERVTPP